MLFDDKRNNMKLSPLVENNDPPEIFKEISRGDVMRWHVRLIRDPELVAFWTEKRGVSLKTLRQYRIGWNAAESRYTIPVVRDGRYVDVKRYKPGATQAKNVHLKGHGTGTRLWGVDRVAKRPTAPVWIFGGEPDALRGSEAGLLALTGTSGEGAVAVRQDLEELRGRDVRICLDLDDAGRAGAVKWAQALLSIAASVRVVELPVFEGQTGVKDLTDWFNGGHDVFELRRTADFTPTYGTRAKRRPLSQLLDLVLKKLPDLGSRNAAGFELACQMRDERYSILEARDFMAQYITAVNDGVDSAYTEREAMDSVTSAYAKPAREPSGIGPDEPYGKLGRILTRSDLAALPKPEPLVEGWLDLRTTTMLIGETGTNKTFALLGWACSIATGIDWLGHKVHVEPTPVILAVGEGGSGMDGRIAAWEDATGIPVPDGMLTTLLRPASLLDAEFWEQLKNLAREKGARVVGLDTFSSLASEADETKDAARVIRHMSDLADALDGTVILAHHTGWAEKGRSRGGSQFEANPDSVIVLQKTDADDPAAPVSVLRKKDKEGESGRRIFVIRVPVLDSCVLATSDTPPEPERTRETMDDLQMAILRIVDDHDPFTLTQTQALKALGGNAARGRLAMRKALESGVIFEKRASAANALGVVKSGMRVGRSKPIKVSTASTLKSGSSVSDQPRPPTASAGTYLSESEG